MLRAHPPSPSPCVDGHGVRAAIRALDHRLDGEPAQAWDGLLARRQAVDARWTPLEVVLAVRAGGVWSASEFYEY